MFKKYLILLITLSLFGTGCAPVADQKDEPGSSSIRMTARIAESEIQSTQTTENAPVPTTRESLLSEEEAMKLPEVFENTKPFRELITTKYKEDDLVKEYIDERLDNRYMSRWISYAGVNAFYPAQCLRKLDNGNVYAVYQTEEGGILYMFFTPKGTTYEYKCQIYSKGVKEYKDFQDVKANDSFSKVEGIDPTVSVLKQIKENAHEKTSNEPLDGFVFDLLLKDGILTMAFLKEGNDYVIWKMHYYSDNIVDYSILADDSYKHELRPIDCTILPHDYP